MRWALVGPLHPYRGGIAHYGALLADELALNDEVVAVNFRRLYPGLLFPGRTQMDESGAPLAFAAPRLLDSLDPLSWLRSARHLAALQPDALVCHWWQPFFAPALGTLMRRMARQAPACRRLLLCHNVLPHERSRIDRMLAAYAMAACQGFLVHSESDAAILRELRPGARLAVHPHPRYGALGDAGGGRPDRRVARERLGIGVGARVALFFGYVRAYKGLDVALSALALARSRGQVESLELWVVGEFYEDRGAYERQIRDLGLSDCVRVVDRYVANEEVADYFAAADLVVQPYRSATQSGIAQIAAACATPVIATNVGGLPEQIEDGVTGLLVPPEDPAALAAAIARFFIEELGPAMGEAANAAAERFSWSGLAGALRSLVEER